MLLTRGHIQNLSKVLNIGSINPVSVLVGYLKGFRTISVVQRKSAPDRNTVRISGPFFDQGRIFFSGAKFSDSK